MGGTGGNNFSPDATMSRAMLATVLWRLAGSPVVNYLMNFSDVETGAWYTEAIRWAASEQVMTGYDNGLFGTNDPVTREQFATVFWRYAGSSPTETGAGFADESSIASYAVQAVDWVRANGIMGGVGDNRFNPKGSATRAQAAMILMNYDLFQQGGGSETPETGNNARILVAYFSATNNTEGVAQHIADSLNADLYEIVPDVPYTSADLNYSDFSSRTIVEQNDASARPAISDSVENMEDYDIVFIGYPIWWGQAPKIIYTFLESYDFSGKTIVPFCTSGSSGIGSSATNLHSLTDNATWLSGQRFSAGASRNTVVSWINGLDLDITAE